MLHKNNVANVHKLFFLSDFTPVCIVLLCVLISNLNLPVGFYFNSNIQAELKDTWQHLSINMRLYTCFVASITVQIRCVIFPSHSRISCVTDERYISVSNQTYASIRLCVYVFSFCLGWITGAPPGCLHGGGGGLRHIFSRPKIVSGQSYYNGVGGIIDQQRTWLSCFKEKKMSKFHRGEGNCPPPPLTPRLGGSYW